MPGNNAWLVRQINQHLVSRAMRKGSGLRNQIEGLAERMLRVKVFCPTSELFFIGPPIGGEILCFH